jgi:hypothetical protein
MPYGHGQPFPKDCVIEPIAPRKPKPKPPIKQKGAIDKLHRDVKKGILNAAIACGYDGEGEGGLDGFFLMCAQKHTRAFLHLVGKLVPLQVQNEISGAMISAVNVISVPHDHYLSAEDIAALRRPGLHEVDRQIVETMPLEHMPEPLPSPPTHPNAPELAERSSAAR